MRVSDFKVLTFDCYGTLIDWEAGLAAALAALLARAGVGREAALEAFAEAESRQEADTPAMRYADILSHVYRTLAARWGVAASGAEAIAFGGSVKDWPAFADTAAALAYLARHYKLVILSNVDRASFAGSAPKLGVAFDAVYTAEEIGSYKPDPHNFAYLLARLAEKGIERKDILHVAQSLFHDHVPAEDAGLVSAWIDRRAKVQGGGATMPPGRTPHYAWRFDSMAALAEAHRREQTVDA
jgi:2-haloacid dehalogenase